MCGIAGTLNISNAPVPGLDPSLRAMSNLIAHRGPDGEGQWQNLVGSVGLVHRRLAIIDLSESAAQPMPGVNGTVITYNGEIYNYKELRSALVQYWSFRSHSDTECILAAYDKYGGDCLGHIRGMFSFLIWGCSKI